MQKILTSIIFVTTLSTVFAGTEMFSVFAQSFEHGGSGGGGSSAGGINGGHGGMLECNNYIYPNGGAQVCDGAGGGGAGGSELRSDSGGGGYKTYSECVFDTLNDFAFCQSYFLHGGGKSPP